MGDLYTYICAVASLSGILIALPGRLVKGVTLKRWKNALRLHPLVYGVKQDSPISPVTAVTVRRQERMMTSLFFHAVKKQ